MDFERQLVLSSRFGDLVSGRRKRREVRHCSCFLLAGTGRAVAWQHQLLARNLVFLEGQGEDLLNGHAYGSA
eukprot:9615308-Prorocentrum_lima.AAC.1